MPQIIVNDVEIVIIDNKKVAKSENLVDDIIVFEKPSSVEKEAKAIKRRKNWSHKVLTHIQRPFLPFTQRLKKKDEEGKYHKFISILKELSVNISIGEALIQMPSYAMFMNDLVIKKRIVF